MTFSFFNKLTHSIEERTINKFVIDIITLQFYEMGIGIMISKPINALNNLITDNLI